MNTPKLSNEEINMLLPMITEVLEEINEGDDTTQKLMRLTFTTMNLVMGTKGATLMDVLGLLEVVKNYVFDAVTGRSKSSKKIDLNTGFYVI